MKWTAAWCTVIQVDKPDFILTLFLAGCCSQYHRSLLPRPLLYTCQMISLRLIVKGEMAGSKRAAILRALNT